MEKFTVVEGVADSASRSPVQLVDEKTGRVRTAAWERTEGHFRAVVPQGRYTIRQGAEHTSLLALSAGSYRVDLRNGKAVDLTAQVRNAGPRDVVVQLEAEGSGREGRSQSWNSVRRRTRPARRALSR